MSASNSYEVIEPPSDLRSKVKVLTGRQAAEFDPVARAEQALTRMSVSFPLWMNEEVETLSSTHKEAKAAGFKGEATENFYRSAHNLRGQAATMGFPVVGNTAGLVCELIEARGEEELPAALIASIIQAVRAMVREDAKGLSNEMAAALFSELRGLTASEVARLEAAQE